MTPRRKVDLGRARRLALFCLSVAPLAYIFATVYSSLIVPFVLALLFAFLLAPAVDYFDRFKIPRAGLAFVIIAFVMIALGFATVGILPQLFEEVMYLVKLAPSVATTVNRIWLPYLHELVEGLGLDAEIVDGMVVEIQDMSLWSERIQGALLTVWNSAPRVLGTVVNIVMTPLLTFFFVKDERRIVEFLARAVPQDLRIPLRNFMRRIAFTLNGVIKGQLTVAAILSLLYMVGLWFSGMYAGVSIGLIAGICRIIPYFDVVVGLTLSGIVIMSDWQGFGQMFFVLSVFAVVQAVDGMLITPKVIGVRLGVHPILVIVTILAFADLWGFWGVLLAIPTVAVGKVIVESIYPAYIQSSLFRASTRPRRPQRPRRPRADQGSR